MPCYNSERFISEAISSVLNQSYKNLELLVCDDGSDDNSQKIIDGFAEKDHRIIKLKNKYTKGASGARNSCLDIASGDFIAFLDSDDFWCTDRIEKHLRYMLENNLFFSYSYNNVVNENGKFISKVLAPERLDLKKMRYANFISCSTVLINKGVTGHFNQPYIKRRNDFATWLSIMNKFPDKDVICFKEITSNYRTNNYGLSSNKIDAAKYFCLCLIRYNNISKISAFFYLLVYLNIILIKKFFPKLYNFLIVKI